MALLLIPAMFLFVALALLCLATLAVAGAVLSVVLRILTAVLWIIVEVLEHRSAVSPAIEIITEDQDRPMRDITPTVSKIRAP
jgi:hypothetical protein